MQLIFFALPLFLAATPAIMPQNVPARGKQEVIIHIAEPGMYRVTASSPEGTACEMVDHLRGPFRSSGVSGKENCEMDLLLDSGAYKLRLRSPKHGKGTTTIEAKPFAELNAEPVRLDDGRSQSLELHPGRQASYWIRIPERRYVLLRAIGRTAGAVHLWRDGEWVEELEVRRQELVPREGQPLHEWSLSGMLEKGNYRFVIYGTEPRRWTKGEERDFLFIANGFAKGPDEGNLVFTFPEWGKISWEVSPDKLVGVMTLAAPAPTVSVLALDSFADKEGDRLGPSGGRCSIPGKALIPVCSAWSFSQGRNLLTVTGPPGTQGELVWSRYNDGNQMADGDYGRMREALSFEAPSSGRYLVSASDVPPDTDAAPLACQLTTRRGRSTSVLARDFLRLDRDHAYDRSLNYNGREETVWFEVGRAGVFALTTAGERKNRCVLYRMDGDRRSIVHDSDPGATECNVVGHLGEGAYELKIYGGKEGIERLKIACVMESPFSRGKGQAKKADKFSCLLPGVNLESGRRYTLEINRRGAAAARGLVLRQIPLKLVRSLTLTVDPGGLVELPVAAGAPLVVSAAGGGAFSCAWGSDYKAEAQDGLCRLPAISKEKSIKVANTSGKLLVLSIRRPAAPRSLAALQKYSPKIPKLPPLVRGKRVFNDFDRGQSRSMIFDVDEPGLYVVTTEGLLSTECRLRTPVVSRLLSGTGGGRGRNCLISGFLNQGRYLLTVKTTGRSRGRAAVILTRRPVERGKPVKESQDVFFTVGAGALVRQDLSVARDGKYRLLTQGQLVSLQCRLEDEQGWPLVSVPTPCDRTLELDAGAYRWMQMPLTVESMRRTELRRITRPLVLRGDKTHTIDLNTDYRAELGKDGKDEFRFRLQAALDVDIFLDAGMQGRVYRIDGRRRELVQPVPPNAAKVSLGLAVGRYVLVTEHSRGDVAISYSLRVSSDVLAPGMSKNVQVPATEKLRMPADGVLRLKTTGQTDVRCRLFDANGRLVAQNGSVGADWNCLIARPLKAGEYRLELEAENTIGGPSRVKVVQTDNQELGTLSDKKSYKTRGKVLLARLPATAGGKIVEIDFRSRLLFSCAIEDQTGKILRESDNVRRCRMFLNPLGGAYSVRLWSRNWYASIAAAVTTRKVEAFGGGRLQRGMAGLVEVSRPGRYATAGGVFCIPAGSSGLLEECGPQASLEAGAYIFSAVAENTPQLDLTEIVADLDRPGEGARMLSPRVFIQRQKSSIQALHLLRVALPIGETAATACRIDGGIHLQNESGCFAAAGPTRETLSRLWISGSSERRGTVLLRAAGVPDKARALEPGVSEIVWSGSVARLALPAAASRLEIVVPHDTWVVQTDAGGKVIDLCPPADGLSSCSLRARGGTAYVASDALRRARVRLLLDPSPPRIRTLEGIYEKLFDRPGECALLFAAADKARDLRVSGAAGCKVRLNDGSLLDGCRCVVPAGQGGELLLRHGVEPLRAVLFEKGAELTAAWGAPVTAERQETLPVAEALLLSGKSLGRKMRLSATAAVHLHADSGVCAMAAGSRLLAVDGRGSGCDILRVLEPGDYEFLVRSFAAQSLGGTLYWTSEPLENLREGVGMESWLAPGETAVFSFTVESAGEVGIGLRTAADVLECTTYDASRRLVGSGCLQYMRLAPGKYILRIAGPKVGKAVAFRPVILGLSGSMTAVPEEYLRDFFRRIGERP